VAPPHAPRHVVVAGGGPAGLECARRLAERGHRVELWEASNRLGGVLALAEQVDPDLDGLLAWLIGAAEDAGVEVHLGRALSAPVAADVVVWATGAAWAPGLNELEGWTSGPSTAVAVQGSSKAALSVALHVRQQGAEVTLRPDDAVLAPELGLPGRFRLVADAVAAGVAIGDDSRPGAVALDIRRRGPRTAPDLGPAVELHVVGDASGEGGLAAAFRAASDVAARI
jgi:hypothetical protein